MKKVVFAVVSMLLVFTMSCKKDSDEATYKNYLDTGGKKYELNKGYIHVNTSTATQGLTVYEIAIMSNNASIVSGDTKGNGNTIEFDLVSSPSGLAEGTYSVASDDSAINTFYNTATGVNCNFNDYTESLTKLYLCDDTKSGTVKVKKSGDTYTFDFDWNLINLGGQTSTLKGHYEGTLTSYTY